MPQISRAQFAAYAIAVVVVVVLGGRALRADGTSASGQGAEPGSFSGQGAADGTVPAAAGTTGAAGVGVTTEAERLIVHVAGAVRRPGVYALDGGARIQDAMRRAGGARPGADLDALNLAAKLTDGQQVLVPRRATRAGGPAAPPAPAQAPRGADGATGGTRASVNINTADATQLEALDGVGPAIAAKIVAWRTANGPFRTVDDLAQVAGIGPKKLEAMRAQAVV